MRELADGPHGLRALPDGSLVVEDRYSDRYSRASKKAQVVTGLDQRTETEHDRGRLGYSPFLRRLAGVTQVVSPDLTAAQMHSRSSHTHKVALVSREIAEHVVRRAWESDGEVAAVIKHAGGLDIPACETAGLAHDLGHPPFGHAGEKALDSIMRRHVVDGFEGNAQSFRIVTELDRDRLGREHGLDLTNVTLAAILKYPYLRRPGSNKFSVYATEESQFRRVREAVLGRTQDQGQQTLESSIMDLADDVAYAIHDLEDFFAAGVIDPRAAERSLKDAIRGVDESNPNFDDSDSENDPFTVEAIQLHLRYKDFFSHQEFLQALGRVLELVDEISDPDDPLGVPQLRTALSAKVQACFQQIRISTTPPWANGPMVSLEQPAWHELQCLKIITKHFLVSTSRMGVLQRAQTMAIRNLFQSIVHWLRTSPKERDLPVPLQKLLSDMPIPYYPADELVADHYRAICDYICQMSDAEALMRSKWLTGHEVPGSSSIAARY